MGKPPPAKAKGGAGQGAREEAELRRQFNLPSCEDFRRGLEANTDLTDRMKLDAIRPGVSAVPPPDTSSTERNCSGCVASTPP